MRPPRQPYALDTPRFAFAAIASFAARAPLGGPREVGLATLVTARMAGDVGNENHLSDAARQARAASARRWLAGMALAEPVRKALGELASATETDASATAAAVRRVIDVTTGVLDGASRADLDRLARELDAQTVGRT